MTPPTSVPAARTPVRITSRRGRRALARLARTVWALARVLAATGALAAVLGGVPYALHRLAPDPWPERRRSLREIRDGLLAPAGDQLLLDALAAVGWIAWAGLALSMLAELVWHLRNLPTLMRDASARRAHRHGVAVWRAPAAWLAGLLIVALVAVLRAAHTTVAAAPAQTAARPAAATALLKPAASLPTPAPALELRTRHDAARPADRPMVAAFTTYTVQPGDTLWDIAAAELGDPIRWPQIYALSRNLPQPDGGRLTDPDLIYPGWVLRLPADAAPPAEALPNEPPTTEPEELPKPVLPPSPPSGTDATPPPQAPATPAPAAPGPPSHAPSTGPPATQPPTTRPPSPAPSRAGPGSSSGRGAVDVPAVGLLGATLAAGIVAAMLWARRHRRRTHPNRTQARPALPPVLTAAERNRHRTDTTEPPDATRLFGHVPLQRRPRLTAPLPPGRLAFAVRDDTEISLDVVAARRGIGLTGPGAADAARAVAAAALLDHERARPDTGTVRLLTDDDTAAELLGPGRDQRALAALPQADQFPDVGSCMDAAEQHLLATARRTHDEPGFDGDSPVVACLVVLVRARSEHHHRLAGIAAGGAADHAWPAVLVVVLGDWPVACSTGPDGGVLDVTHPDPGLLEGARVLHLSEDAFGDLADELGAAHGQGPSYEPALPIDADDDDDQGGWGEPDFFGDPGYTPRPAPALSAGGRRDEDGPRAGSSSGASGPPPLPLPLPSPPRGADRHTSRARTRPAPEAADPGIGGDPPGPDEGDTEDSDERPLRPDGDWPGPTPHPRAPGPTHADVRPPSAASAPISRPPIPLPGAVGQRSTVPAPPLASTDPSDPGPSAPPADGAVAARGTVTLRLLGPFRIEVAGRQAPVGAHLHSTTREFLALLATHPDGIRTAQLADRLELDHPDPTETARQLSNLRRAVRRLLRDATSSSAAFVVSDGDRHHLDPTTVRTDLAAFTAALDRAAHTPDDQARTAALEDALATYTGDLLDGADYPWAEPLREHHRRCAADAAARLAELADTAGHSDAAIAWLDRAIDLDPYNEPLYQQLIRLQTALGRDDAAHRTYTRLTDRLAELDGRPDPATRALLPPHRTPPRRRAV